MANEISLNIAKSYLSLNEESNNQNLSQLTEFLNAELLLDLDKSSFGDGTSNFEQIVKVIEECILSKINHNMSLIDDTDKIDLIRNIFLTVIDEDWRNHLNAMDYLRQGIGLRGYAQKNPKNEYKRESFEMFEEMLYTNNYETLKILSRIKVKENTSINDKTVNNNLSHNKKPTNGEKNISRNAPCPCGSGKKYKRCCGRL